MTTPKMSQITGWIIITLITHFNIYITEKLFSLIVSYNKCESTSICEVRDIKCPSWIPPSKVTCVQKVNYNCFRYCHFNHEIIHYCFCYRTFCYRGDSPRTPGVHSNKYCDYHILWQCIKKWLFIRFTHSFLTSYPVRLWNSPSNSRYLRSVLH